MNEWISENSVLLCGVVSIAYCICEVLAHTAKFKANSLFQAIFGGVKGLKSKVEAEREKKENENKN